MSIEIQLIFLWYKDDPKITVSLPYEINQFTNLTNLLQLVLLKLNLWTWGESALPCCWPPLSLGKWLYDMCSLCISMVILFSCFFFWKTCLPAEYRKGKLLSPYLWKQKNVNQLHSPFFSILIIDPIVLLLNYLLKKYSNCKL